MGTVMESYEFLKNTTITNETFISNNSGTGNAREDSIRIIQSSVASVGIIANLTVIVVFLNHRKLRRKIPNIFIINQVRKLTHLQVDGCYQLTGNIISGVHTLIQ